MTGRLLRDAPFCSVRGQHGIRKGFITCSSTVARKAGAYHPSPRLRQRRGAGVQQPRPVLIPAYSPKCMEVEFCEVGLSLPLRVCGLFFLDYLQALDHLEGEAHYAALPPLVLEVDGFVVVVDEDLRHKPAAVVEPLCPLWDIFVLYLFGLLAHPHDLLSLGGKESGS